MDAFKVARLTDDALEQIQRTEKDISHTTGKNVVLVAYENNEDKADDQMPRDNQNN